MKSSTILTIIFAIFLVSSSGAAQQNGSFILLENGQTLNGKVELENTFLAEPYLMLNDSGNYILAEDKAYQSVDGYFVRLRRMQ